MIPAGWRDCHFWHVSKTPGDKEADIPNGFPPHPRALWKVCNLPGWRAQWRHVKMFIHPTSKATLLRL